MKIKPLNFTIRKILLITACALVVVWIARVQRPSMTAPDEAVISLEQARILFPKAERLDPVLTPDSDAEEQADQLFYVFDKGNQRIGKIINSGLKSTAQGYAGNVPVVIGLDPAGKIIGVELGRHVETPDVVVYMRNRGFFNSWNGLTAQGALAKDVDAVSSATLTAQAVIAGVRNSLSSLSGIEASSQTARSEPLWMLAALVVLAFAVISFFYPKKFSRWRFWLLCLTALVFGFWGKEMFSLAQFLAWVTVGPGRLSLLFGILIFSAAVSVSTGKDFYCYYLCPYGALQEILARANKKKFSFSKAWHKKAVVLGWVYFCLILIGLMLGFSMALESFEPFSAFLLTGAARTSLVIAGVFLLVACFVPRAWCVFFCPTGKVFKILRTKSSDKVE